MSSPFAPYVVRDSGLSLDEALQLSNSACYEAGISYSLNALEYYSQLLQAVKRIGRCETRCMADFMQPIENDRVVVGLRHDVDHDIIVARAMSRMEARLGMRGSYYLLHSHPFVTPSYYAQYDADQRILLRNNCLSAIYQEIQDCGCEVGLHVDAVRLYENGIDGQAAMTEELRWLREQGLNIAGISAHGSAPYYGVENFEFFSEYHLGHTPAVHLAGADIALGQLSAREIGITYEANYARPPECRDEARVKLYLVQARTETAEHLRWYLHANPYCRWGADYTCWLYDHDCWALAGQGEGTPWKSRASFIDVLDLLGNAPAGSRVLLHVHPFYLGLRNNAYAYPY